MKSSEDSTVRWLRSAPGRLFLSDLVESLHILRDSHPNQRYSRVNVGHIRFILTSAFALRYRRHGRFWILDSDIVAGLRSLYCGRIRGLQKRRPRRLKLVWSRLSLR